MRKRAIANILLRYSLLILVGIFSVPLFHFLFLKLTLYSVYFLFKIFFNTSVSGNILWIANFPIEMIGACVAGSAYSLLLILNLAAPEIKLKKRILMISLSFLIFLLINVLRIFSLSIMLMSANPLFDFTHKLFWYAGSTIVVVAIWFFSVKLFKVKSIPFYTDIKNFYLLSKKNFNSKRRRKH